MSPLSDPIVTLFSVITLIGQLVSVGLILVLLISRFLPKQPTAKKLTRIVTENFVVIVLIVSGIATMGSLTFSEVLNFAPCKLCWFQRIFMYPLVIISFVSLIKNDSNIKKYIMPLAAIGLIIAGYHILVQTFPTILECSDEVAKCSAKEFAKFGYITIPVMSFSAFAMILAAGMFGLKKK